MNYMPQLNQKFFILGLIFIVYLLFSGNPILSAIRKEKIIYTEEINIGWIGPLTGPVSFLGIENSRAISLAVDDYNEHRSKGKPRINLILKDDQYIAEKSKTAYEDLVRNYHVPVVFISTYNAYFLLHNEFYKDNVIAINPIDSDEKMGKLNRNIFMIAKQTEDTGKDLAKYFEGQNINEILILSDNDDEFMPTLSNAVKQSFENTGGQVTMTKYSASNPNFIDELPKFNDPTIDAYLLFGYVELGPVIRKIRDTNPNAQIYTANLAMAESSGDAFNNIKFINFTSLDGNTKLAEEFIDKYKDKYNETLVHEWTALQAYDGIQILIRALNEAIYHEGDLKTNIRTELYRTDDFNGVSGKLNVTPSGSVTGITWGIYEYRNGISNKL